ncbi:MAG: RHS repeat-associated core domain-containing protein [Alcanivoracaceae bacterium]
MARQKSWKRLQGLLVMMALATNMAEAQMVSVAPLVGEWRYSHVRCAETTHGFTSDAAAEAHGANHHYGSCGDASIIWSGPWGTPEERTYGTCGSWNTYPRFQLGFENINVRHSRVRFCESRYSNGVVDSFAIYRRRDVTCPAGFRASGTVCIANTNEEQPGKGPGRECPNNGSNPINSATGNKYQHEVDIEPAPGGPGFARHYNSYQVLMPGSLEPGLPANWRHSYSRNIHWRSGGVVTAVLSRPDGRAWNFSRDSQGAWRSDSDVPGRLEADMDEDDFIGWRYHTATNQVEHYNGAGQLEQITDSSGLLIRLHYDHGRLAEVADRYGHRLQLEYYSEHHDHSGWLAAVTGPDSTRWDYDYDDNGNLVSVTYPGEGGHRPVRRYHYNEPEHTDDTDLPHALTGITLETGQRFSSYRYDPQGRAVSSEHGSMQANLTRIAYHADGTRTVTDALGQERLYQYIRRVGVSRVTSISAPCQQCGSQGQQHQYDTQGRLTRRIDFRGTDTRFRYEDPHRPDLETWRSEAVGRPEQRTLSTEWHPQWRSPVRRAEPLRLTRWHYQGDPGVQCGGYPGALCRMEQWATRDANGVQGFAATPDGEPRITRWQYVPVSGGSAAAGKVLSVDGPRDDVTDITYYQYDHQRGYLIATVNSLGHRTEYQDHDAWGRPQRSVDINGLVTRSDYHPRGWLLRQQVGETELRFEYDEAGQRTAVVDATGSVTRFEYDDARRLVGIRDAQGNRLRFTLNPLGERVEEWVEDAAGTRLSGLTREYDQLNRLKTLLDGEGNATRYEYDSAGNPSLISSPEGRITAFQYDALNRLQSTIDALQGVALFQYQGNDRTRLVRDPNQAETRYEYDGLDNLRQLHSADTGVTQHAYDPVGNRLRSTDARGITVLYQYDALNRLTQIRYPDSDHDANLIYDEGVYGNGRLTTIQEQRSRLNLGYDIRGNLQTQVSELGQARLEVGYEHDAANRLVGLRYPSGVRIEYRRNAEGKIEEISAFLPDGEPVTLATDMRYQPFGDLIFLRHGNGQTLRREHNGAGQLIRHQEGSLYDLVFGYDRDGNLISRTAPYAAGLVERYNYDGLNRLIRAEGGFGLIEYRYDAVGNRLEQTRQQGVQVAEHTLYIYQSASNRLTRAGNLNYQYDPAGNPVVIGALQYDYDDRGRLAAVRQGDELVAEYGYNLLGQRLSKTLPGMDEEVADWHRAQAAEAEADAGRLAAELMALELDQASQWAAKQAALNVAEQRDQAAGQWLQQAETQRAQSERHLEEAAQRSDAANIQQQRADSALASRSADWYGWLINWWYDLQASRHQWEATRLDAEAASLESQASELLQQATISEQQASLATAEAEHYRHMAEQHAAALADLGATRDQKTAELADAMDRAAYHLAMAEQPDQNGRQLYFAYNQAGLLIGEYSAKGNPIREYIYRDMIPIALLVYNNGRSRPDIGWYHVDQLGTPQAVTGTNGEILWRARYHPFGEVDILTSHIVQPLRFPGQYHDEETGLYYNYFRYYDPGIGRYLRSDPIGLIGGMNTYSYVMSRPLDHMDIYGLRPMKDVRRPDGKPLVHSCEKVCYTEFAAASLLTGGVGSVISRYVVKESMFGVSSLYHASNANSIYGIFDLGRCLKECEKRDVCL